MKILHTYCLNYNIGDYALGIGVKNLLRHYLPVDFIGETNIQGQYFNQYYINEVINKRYDLLVIGGGGVIHGSHWPNGWFWLIEKDLIKTIKIPFIIYGVGDNYFDGQSIPLKAVDHLNETNKYALSFSVRNDGSLERVKRDVGFTPVEVPDPGFHVGLNQDYPHLLKQKYVIVQVANDKVEDRFVDISKKSSFIQSMRNIVSYLSSRYHVLLAPHVFADVSLSKEIMEGIPNCSIWNFGMLAFDHTDIAISYYKYAEFVLAMRGHGQIIPIGFNVPVIALCNHPKHLGLMEKLGMSEWAISIGQCEFEHVLIEKIKNLVKDKDKMNARLNKINENLCFQSEKYFQELKTKLELHV